MLINQRLYENIRLIRIGYSRVKLNHDISAELKYATIDNGSLHVMWRSYYLGGKCLSKVRSSYPLEMLCDFDLEHLTRRIESTMKDLENYAMKCAPDGIFRG